MTSAEIAATAANRNLVTGFLLGGEKGVETGPIRPASPFTYNEMGGFATHARAPGRLWVRNARSASEEALRLSVATAFAGCRDLAAAGPVFEPATFGL